jgi:hypothetical protein
MRRTLVIALMLVALLALVGAVQLGGPEGRGGSWGNDRLYAQEGSASNAPDFGIDIAPPTLVLHSNSKGAFLLTAHGDNGYGADVNLSVSGLPADASGVFNLPVLHQTPYSTLIITTGATTGTYPLTVTGVGPSLNGGGAISHSYPVTLVIDDSQPETPLPAGANLTLATATGTPAAPDFSISLTPSQFVAHTNSKAAFSLVATGSNGYGADVQLSVTGLPSDAFGVFSPPLLHATPDSTLFIATGVTPGMFPLTVTATGPNPSGGPDISHTSKVTLVIDDSQPETALPAGVRFPTPTPVPTRPPLPDFSISVRPGTLFVSAASKGVLIVETTSQGNLQAKLELSVSGLPADSYPAFIPSTVGPDGVSNLVITTGSTKGTFPVVITAKGAGLTHSTTAVVVIR